MAVDFEMKQHDTLPEIAGTCADSEGNIPNLAGASVRFIMTNKADGVKVIDRPAVIVDVPTAEVKFSWQPGDTDTPGTYKGEYEVTYSGGGVETFPNDRYINIKIFPDLGGNA